MIIKYITQFYTPETGAASARANENTRFWCKNGHDVNVLTGFPNYPKGQLFPGFKNRIYAVEKQGKLSVIRTLTYFPNYSSIILRLINQIIFYLFSILGGLRMPRPKIILATSPPFGIGLVGYILSRCLNAKFVFEVRDLFPESAIQFGVLKNSLLIRFLKTLENFFYQKADLVIGVTQGICDYIINSGVPQSKIRKITNGVNTETFKSISSNEFRKKHNLDNDFVVMYTGIHGRAENLSILVEAARILKKKVNIKFVLVGEGVEKVSLIGLKEKYNLENILFLDNQKSSQMPSIISAADLCFSSRKDTDINQGALPVKIFEYMACEKPVVICIKGEAEKLIKNANSGVCLDPQDAEALALKIEELSNDKKILKSYGLNGRKYVLELFDRNRLANDYLKLLSEIVTEK